MVAAKNIIVNARAFDQREKIFGDYEIIQSPARIVFPRTAQIAPPAILHFIRIQRPESIHKTAVQKLAEFGPLLIRKAGMASIRPRIANVYFVMRDIQISA